MYIKNLIKSIEACEGLFNKNDYRKLLAKAICLMKSYEFHSYAEIQFQTNLELLKRNLAHVSYNFIVTTLKSMSTNEKSKKN